MRTVSGNMFYGLIQPQLNPMLNMSKRNLPLFIGSAFVLALALAGEANAQINSGSNGSDGALDFSAITTTTNIVIDMHDHTNGVYNYTYVVIPSNVTVSFTPNAYNSPVTWLVQSNVLINGTVDVSGQNCNGPVGGSGGPGGWSGGSSGNNATAGQGPGGGGLYTSGGGGGEGGSYATLGKYTSATVYGNTFLLPLLGGSGGSGGTSCIYGGGGGGGAILIASSLTNKVNGVILAVGGSGGQNPGNANYPASGGGSGGGIRLVSSVFISNGSVSASGGGGYGGGLGRVRIDAFQIALGGQYSGVLTTGFQPIITPIAGQGVQLAVASVGGIGISGNPSSSVLTPAAIIPGQQANPIQVVVNCTNLPLNTPVTVTITPQIGSPVSAVGYNNTGTVAASTATVSLVVPRGGGVVWASAAAGN